MDTLYRAQVANLIQRFPVSWMRGELREMLGTMPVLASGDARGPETSAGEFASAARPALSRLVGDLSRHERDELLLGFPRAPFILPLHAEDPAGFLEYLRAAPGHQVRLQRVGRGPTAEWAITIETALDDFTKTYRLTFSLPEELELWISRDEEERIDRTLDVKEEFLSDIVIYRVEDDIVSTFQLQYRPQDLRRQRRRTE